MCGICGCGAPARGAGSATGEGRESRTGAPGNGAGHSHDHGHAHGDTFVRVEQEILALNDAHAGDNRRWFDERNIFALNVMSSPGAGKTTLLVATIHRVRGRMPVAVIEGDQQTDNDARRIRSAGAAAVQVNTGRGCHLDAHVVGHAAQELDPRAGSILFIENVGNLVCPAAFDLGESARVAILSTTEGSDKPAKYPDMFLSADLLLLNKIDLLPYLEFDADAAIGFARDINPGIEVIRVSATRGDGLDEWIEWLGARMHVAAAPGMNAPRAGVR